MGFRVWHFVCWFDYRNLIEQFQQKNINCCSKVKISGFYWKWIMNTIRYLEIFLLNIQNELPFLKVINNNFL